MKSDAINIFLELELRRDRICSWRAEADIISTGCIPVVFIKEIVAPRRKCHRLPSEMGIPRNPQIHQRLSANRNRSAFTIIAICISDQCSAGIGQTPCHLKRICRLVHQRQVSRPLRHRIYASAVIQAMIRLCLFVWNPDRKYRRYSSAFCLHLPIQNTRYHDFSVPHPVYTLQCHLHSVLRCHWLF